MKRAYSFSPPLFFALFALCCLLPFIAAKFALSLRLFSPGVSNKGSWIEQELRLPHPNGLWQLLYVQRGQCDRFCELELYSLQQLYTGLGAKREQVSVGLLALQAPAELVRYPALRWQSSIAAVPQKFNGQLLLVNRQGQVLLHYDAVANQQDAMITAKKIRADLLRLLAFDRPMAVLPSSTKENIAQ
jgi:hypothetical protein